MTKDILLDSFDDPLFQESFKKYFSELGMNVGNWEALFKAMNSDTETKAYLRVSENGDAVGFIQIKIISLSNNFFEEQYGFIREFWVSPKYRKRGHGTSLLDLAEQYFVQNEVMRSILTTDTAEGFYVARGYEKRADVKAKNNMEVFIKKLKV